MKDEEITAQEFQFSSKGYGDERQVAFVFSLPMAVSIDIKTEGTQLPIANRLSSKPKSLITYYKYGRRVIADMKGLAARALF
jgi:hypothetical protein